MVLHTLAGPLVTSWLSKRLNNGDNDDGEGAAKWAMALAKVAAKHVAPLLLALFYFSGKYYTPAHRLARVRLEQQVLEQPDALTRVGHERNFAVGLGQRSQFVAHALGDHAKIRLRHLISDDAGLAMAAL